MDTSVDTTYLPFTALAVAIASCALVGRAIAAMLGGRAERTRLRSCILILESAWIVAIILGAIFGDFGHIVLAIFFSYLVHLVLVFLYGWLFWRMRGPRTTMRREDWIVACLPLVGGAVAAQVDVEEPLLLGIRVALALTVLLVPWVAWRHAPRGTSERNRRRALFAAFVVRALVWIPVGVAINVYAAVVSLVAVAVAVVMAEGFLLLTAYGLLPPTGPEGEPRVRRALRRHGAWALVLQGGIVIASSAPLPMLVAVTLVLTAAGTALAERLGRTWALVEFHVEDAPAPS